MGYKNGKVILPEDLIKQIQEYVDGDYVYIPRKEGFRKSWGDTTDIKKILQESKSEHQELEKEIDTLLSTHGMHEKEPHPVAKGMSWMKTNMKLAMNNSDQTIAVLVTDGCDMGINSLQKYLNEHENADHIAKGMCKKLISIEEK